ncbi:bifunctional DNA primase/polymerase [Streptomyces radicis]|uniref:DNA primase n=1 Tax=Streptomyces radicis TaxID=1750517 RepID=A0A3A9W371_9ACTN|nr:bifunctional DNA primase/polymerase [Streptomyces radicis]RKN07290.1 DNA primase [Streptomyces radicis]RKN26694.1 DNA primase [Streptomyces radicis]
MAPDVRTALLNAALHATEHQWPVFPLRPGGKRPAGHGADDCPGTGRCSNGHLKPEQRATTDPSLIRACWQHRPYNVGLATGPAGLLVVDLDTLKPTDEEGTPDGVTAFTALCERAGQPAPTTRRIRTPSGGEHLYFATPDGARLPSSKGKLARKIDTRAWGGYVVAPGSTVDGQVYEVIDPAPVAPLPDWLRQTLTPPPPPRRTTIPTATGASRAGRYAQAALDNETATVAATTEGGRDEALLRGARALGRFIAWGDLPRHVVEQALQEAGETAGLPPSQCRSTIRSALNWSIANNPRRGVTA